MNETTDTFSSSRHLDRELVSRAISAELRVTLAAAAAAAGTMLKYLGEDTTKSSRESN